jgi:hypothetical protein
LQHQPERADRANEAATDHNLVGGHVAFHAGVLAEDYSPAIEVALNVTIEMDLSLRRNVASDC